MSTDNSDKTNGLLANPLPIVMLVLLTAGVVVKNVNLNSARPIDPEKFIVQSKNIQDIEARLWQDPFAAIVKHEKNFPKGKGKDESDHKISVLKAPISEYLKRDKSNPNELLTVVAVSVFGNSYVEAAEYRRRSRFAVVSALSRNHFYPQNPDAIGYFKTTVNGQSLNVPFEWYEREKSPKSSVLVLWLDEEKFNDKPLTELKLLFGDLSKFKGTSNKLNFKLVGPAGSRMYAALKKEAKNQPKNQPKYGQPARQFELEKNVTLQVFSPGATISDCSVSEPDKKSVAKCIFKDQPTSDSQKNPDVKKKPSEVVPPWIVRTIGTDDVLSVALLWELWQRGVNRESWSDFTWAQPVDNSKTESPSSTCRDGLILISEQDTKYARTLSLNITHNFSFLCDTKSDLSVPKLVRRFTYLRGLDGVLPDRDKSDTNASHKEDGEKSKDPLAQLKDAPKEHAEGRSQYDYLRRLADEIAELDKDSKFAKNGIKAIGIVGSDVYDKLLILQALKSRFKDKVFFTTDLDARYLHADQKDWARNLVVASNFGLSLSPELQNRTLPFRDGYQTATYLATLMALYPEVIDSKVMVDWPTKMKKWLHPQIFEIGRTKAVHVATLTNDDLYNWYLRGINGSESKIIPQDIIPPKPPCKPEDSAEVECMKPCEIDKFAVCTTGIEPIWPLLRPSFKHATEIFLMVIFGFALIAMASRYVHKMLRTAINLLIFPANAKAAIFWKWGAVLLVSVVLYISMCIWNIIREMNDSLKHGIGEPFLWLEGISVWPSLILSFIGLALTLLLALALWIWIRREARLISTRFKFGLPQTWKRKRRWYSAMFAGPYVDLTLFNREDKVDLKTVYSGVEIATLWQNYLCATGMREMKGWILFSTAIVVLLGYAAFQVFGMPIFPHRGQLVEKLDFFLVSLNALVLWLVIFWVVFQTRACEQFIKMLSNMRSLWPEELLEQEEGETGVPRAFLADYLDFKLVMSVAQRVHWLIYLPFIPIFFMAIARNELFDAMYFPLVLAFFIGLVLVYALCCEVLLRRAAVMARNKALDYYEMLLWRTLASRPPKSNAKKNPEDGSSGPGTVNGVVASPASKDDSASTATNNKDSDSTEPPIRAEQIKLLMERIRSNREGVFAPITEQPALRALLMPFGGFGGVQLFEYLMNLTP
ncbi:hypothetical protein [Candidatus Nitrotoga arctica]|uniref:Uncharacterized protein n=1 Tax=Candidatus Nitrotoga arctica TaxID=453162 RepID=A0ABN8ANV0_9PROT|nr:hypothetical protein [Candidatus Nitrotoga arctica]CAG9932140.1 conserved membrane protein of unknown function [Candidatus Nitrotoga arctica]